MKFLLGLLLFLTVPFAAADQSVYTDQLNISWQDWSWAPDNLADTSAIHTGTHSILVSPNAAWQALSLHHAAQSTPGFQAITFWINGGANGGQLLQVNATLSGTAKIAYNLPALPKNVWQKVTVPLVSVGAANTTNFDGFWIQDRSGVVQSPYSVDDISLTVRPASVGDLSIYADALATGWTSAGTATVGLGSTTLVHSGTKSMSVTGKAAGDGFYARHAAIDGSLYQTLRLWVNGGPTGGQLLKVTGTASGVAQKSLNIAALAKNTWRQLVIPLASLGVSARGDFDGFKISDRGGLVEPTYYVDDATLSATPATTSTASITVNATTFKAISPYIYGVNSADFAGMGKGFTLTRQGGNRLTAYNWENNASNAGSDYFYQNDGYMGATNEPGWTGRTFVQASVANGAAPLVTVQTVGYVSADKNGGGDVRNTPNYLAVRFKQSLPTKGSAFVYPPNTADAFVYQDEFVSFINQFAKPGLPVMFNLDNEPDLWSSSHPEVHPKPVTYAELMDNNITYAKAIKAVVPSGLVFGPASYGWSGYRTLQGATDANGRDFLSFYLAGMKQAELANGKRLLDALDLHWYPEAVGDGIRIIDPSDSPGLADARIQAPRSLWDPTYVENSWIAQSIGNKPIKLLPDTFSRIASNYPGTKLSFGEYNYGGDNAISGAIAEADVLGIFGRYGVFAAANWQLNASAKAMLAGFKAFRNFDRAGKNFGDQSLPVSGETAASNSVYAALDSTTPGRMTLVVINKSLATTPFAISFTGFNPGNAKAYSITAGNFINPITTAATITGGIVHLNAPQRSVTSIELTAAL